MRNLCDEIDRLQDQLKRTEEAREFAAKCGWPTPRSIKDDPPNAGENVLVYDYHRKSWCLWFSDSVSPASSYSHWPPMPPPPPKPDPFEEWRATMDVSSDGVIKLVYQYPIVGITHYHYIPAQAAQSIWDAAMKAKGYETPTQTNL